MSFSDSNLSQRISLMVNHNLPRQSTPFIGRGTEVAELAQLLGDPACQLLTLVGPGGSGKTRLAIEIAGRKLEDFPNGVYFVPLAPLSSPDHIVPSVAHAVDLHFGGGDDPRQGLLDYLRHKHLLLVMDNFEHLLAGGELIADILATAPEVKILATSRETLSLQEEWVR